MHRAVQLGCGGRGKHQLATLVDTPGIEVTAVCDLIEERRTEAVQKFSIPKAYADYDEMLEKEKPDIVNTVTQPDVRIMPVKQAAAAGAKAVIIEKPLAILPSEGARLAQIQQETGIKVAVCFQRRFFPQYPKLREAISGGAIGQVRYIRCTTQSTLLDMGTHMMDLLLMLLGEPEPEAVWATASEPRPYESVSHGCPKEFLADYTFPGDISVSFECTPQAVAPYPDGEGCQHCVLAFWGTGGRAWATQNCGWGYLPDGGEAITGESSFNGQTEDGQREFFQAVSAWVEDDSKPHECQLDNALRGFNALMGGLKSVALGRRITLPTEMTDADWRAARHKVYAAG